MDSFTQNTITELYKSMASGYLALARSAKGTAFDEALFASQNYLKLAFPDMTPETRDAAAEQAFGISPAKLAALRSTNMASTQIKSELSAATEQPIPVNYKASQNPKL